MIEDADIRFIPPADVEEASQSWKVQPVVDAYTHWVLGRLVGIKGRSVPDVAYFILRDWIQSHQEELAHLGIDVHVRQGRLIVQRND
ncbi:MAG: hypothetical protein AMS18_16190 [Gemmatimonas sp. SG8_17]|nr:MAG: hypothetical protein AMS18_16190 [Gemmatimonas sp. SG8_17]